MELIMDVRYVAGIIDGEGSLYIHKQRRRNHIRYEVRAQVANTNHELLKLLKSEYYGSIYPYKLKERHRKAYLWATTNKNALHLINDVYPFLIIKREVAKLILSFPKVQSGKRMTPDVRQKRIEIYKVVKQLNRRGPRDEQLTLQITQEAQLRLL